MSLSKDLGRDTPLQKNQGPFMKRSCTSSGGQVTRAQESRISNCLAVQRVGASTLHGTAGLICIARGFPEHVLSVTCSLLYNFMGHMSHKHLKS